MTSKHLNFQESTVLFFDLIIITSLSLTFVLSHPPSHSADTGFKHVVPVEYKPRLLHFHGERKRIEVKEKEALRSNLDSTDVFILDLGLELYQVSLIKISKTFG